MLRASVIVPVRDAARTLPRTLDALAGQRLEGEYEVIVVDDGSSDATRELARQAGPAVKLLCQDPLGPGAARNRGVAAAGAGALAFCDADVYPTPGWLAAGLAALERADVVQGKVLPDPAVTIGPFDRSIWITSEVGLFETANLFVTRDAFDRTGGFEDWLAPRRGKALAEDVWFGYRAVRAGAGSGFCPEALAYHEVFPRSWIEYAHERTRLRYFPAMAAKMPELRTTFLHRRVFLNSRSARLDLALAGAAGALLTRRGELVLAALPYASELRGRSLRARPAGPRALAVCAADLAADAVGLAALVAGSVRYRSAVL